jgi:hypothetical protein
MAETGREVKSLIRVADIIVDVAKDVSSCCKIHYIH